MNTLFRSVIAIVGACAVAVITVAASEHIVHSIIDFPTYSEATKASYMQAVPTAGKIAVVTGWAIAALAGSVVGSLIMRRRSLLVALSVAAVLTASILINVSLIGISSAGGSRGASSSRFDRAHLLDPYRRYRVFAVGEVLGEIFMDEDDGVCVHLIANA